jgi:hypothetical protein
MQAMELVAQQSTTRGIDAKKDTVGVPYNKMTFVERWIPGVTQFTAGAIVLLSAVCIAAFSKLHT